MSPPDKVIFLDRDGVINKDPGGWTKYDYVADWRDFQILPGVFEALKLLKANGCKVVIISNQAGVGKGYFTEDGLKAIDQKMRKRIVAHGGDIEASYYCVHTPEADCGCRKPKTGLFERAGKKLNMDFSGAYFIGDTRRDVEAGRRAGLKTILVLTGKASRDEAEAWGEKPDHIFENLLEAVRWLLKY